MLGSRGRFTVVGSGLVVLVVLASTAYLLLPSRQTRDIAVPSRDATPEQVVAAYLDALNAHDCGTAEALTTDEAEGSAKSWCEDVAELTDVHIDDPVMERPRESGHSAGEEVADVAVSFNLNWRLFHNDVSMAEGGTDWGYLLVRGSSHSPWRIFDQGEG